MNFFIKNIAHIVYLWAMKLEKRMPYRIDFSNVSSNWIRSEVIYPMDKVWKKQGINAIGMNYFTVGTPGESELSSRFEPSSPFFQSWVGAYIFQTKDKHEWTIEKHFSLAIADQKNWLKIYGIKDPEVYVVDNQTEYLGEIMVSSFKGKLYFGAIQSDTDVSSYGISWFRRCVISGISYLYSFRNPKISYSPSLFVPPDNIKGNPPKSVLLRGYIAIIELDYLTKAVIYISAADMTNEGLGEYTNNYFDENKTLLLQQIKLIKIAK